VVDFDVVREEHEVVLVGELGEDGLGEVGDMKKELVGLGLLHCF